LAASAREPGSLPFPDRPAGAPNEEMPFDHVVVVMMENHSFDNLLGELSVIRADVDGLSFDGDGNATNSNPGTAQTAAEVMAFPFPDTGQATHVRQSWKATHTQIDGGAMDGFVRSVNNSEPMGYYTRETLPFAYSLASTFTVANRWFCSLPGPTYPNRRFLLAGTAYGGTETKTSTILESPPRGTIFDVLSRHRISWADYHTDIPGTLVIASVIRKYPGHHHRLRRFFDDCAAGTLPQVSFVDPGAGVLASIAQATGSKLPPLRRLFDEIFAGLERRDPAGTEESPQDMYYGEAWAHRVLEAILSSPAWPRTLVIYVYDEHGGYYDHVPPPAAIAPDDIPPKLQPGDPPGGYDLYGPRVPAVIVSPYSKPGASSDVVCDHTSVLATIEAKWNLPALTRRDANANTVMDFLDPANAALLEPPEIATPVAPRQA
jgi:phospholipase C